MGLSARCGRRVSGCGLPPTDVRWAGALVFPGPWVRVVLFVALFRAAGVPGVSDGSVPGGDLPDDLGEFPGLVVSCDAWVLSHGVG